MRCASDRSRWRRFGRPSELMCEISASIKAYDGRGISIGVEPLQQPRRILGTQCLGYECVSVIVEQKTQNRDCGDGCFVHAAHRKWNRFAGSAIRSEEQTSELQSLMSISYDVFCLKKKNTNDD